MGLFSSKVKTSSTSGSYNAGLDAYTKPLFAFTPWSFATLDPTSAMAAMGSGTSLGGKNLGQEFKTQLGALSKEEQDQAKFDQEAMQRIRTRQESGQFLTPQETQFINTSLDKAFEYAHKTGYEDWQRAGAYMAGSRGLRMSDTPAAQPMAQELRNFELGLGSQRAQMGLNATMGMSQQQNAFDQAIHEFQSNLAQNKWATRQQALFGGGMNAASGISSNQWGRGTTTSKASTMSNIGQTIGVIGQGVQLAGSFASPFTGGLGGAGGAMSSAPGAGGWGGMMGMSSNPYA